MKLADHFVIAEDFKRNWYEDSSREPEYGFWSPEIVNDWRQSFGWRIVYETMEADLWAMGLVFLESMLLKSSYELYFYNEND